MGNNPSPVKSYRDVMSWPRFSKRTFSNGWFFFFFFFFQLIAFDKQKKHIAAYNTTYKDIFMVKPDRFMKKWGKRELKTESRRRENTGENSDIDGNELSWLMFIQLLSFCPSICLLKLFTLSSSSLKLQLKASFGDPLRAEIEVCWEKGLCSLYKGR